MSKRKMKRARSAQEKALFVGGLFRPKVERDRTKFSRKRKHKNDD